MVLRVPKTLKDLDLLEDEPLKSRFEAQSLEGSEPLAKRTVPERHAFYTDIEITMRAEANGLNAARAWLRTAFQETFEEEHELKSVDLDVFVKYYWILFKGGNEAPHHAGALLYSERKARGMNEKLDNGYRILENPLPSRHAEPPNPSTSRIGPKQGAGNTRQRKRAKGDSGASRHGRCKDTPLTAPNLRLRQTDARSSPVSAPATAPRKVQTARTECTAPLHPHRLPAKPVSSKKKQGSKRRAAKTPSHSGHSSGDEVPPFIVNSTSVDCPSSPLTALPDSEDESSTSITNQTTPPTPPAQSQGDALPCIPTKTSTSTKSTRSQPLRGAANRDKLQLIMAGENAHRNSLRRGKKVIPQLSVEESASSAPPKIISSGADCVPDPRKPSAKTRTRTKSGISKALPVVESPQKKRRGNAGKSIVSPTTTDVVTASATSEEFQKSLSFFASPCNLALDASATGAHGSGTLRASSVSANATHPVVTAPTAIPINQGKKRLREDKDTPGNTRATPLVSQASTRLMIRIPRRPKADSSPVAPLPMQQEGLKLMDDLLRDAAANGLIVLRNTEEQAPEWPHDPDRPQPGDEEQDATAPTEKSRTYPLQESSDVTFPSSVSISIDYAKDQDMEMCSPEFESMEEYDTRLTLCPLFDDPLESQDAKIPLSDYPPIWAKSRQEVCESFDWFRSYQGGVYFVKDIVKGYLLSAFSASRDLFHHGGKLIISHGGGKAAQSLAKAPGTVKASDQQENDKSVRALLHNYRTRRPLVLIIDDKYALFPFDLASKGCTYAILGWYQIAYAWAEYQEDLSSPSGRVVRYKFAFQWCEAQGSPWWSTMLETQLDIKPYISPKLADVADEKTGQVCAHCSEWSPEVYEEGWMCLKPRCAAFWHLRDAEEVPTSLNYSAPFLRPVKLETNHALEDLRPPLPVLMDASAKDQITTSRHFSKGWHCQKCGRLSSRWKWEHWECQNCAHTYSIPGRLRTANEFFGPPKGKFDTHLVNKQSGIKVPDYRIFKSENAFGTRITFTLPFNRGKIHALLSRPTMNGQANDILRQYQEQASEGSLKFRRWPLRSHKCRGTLLTNYFSQNTGEPYQYVGGTDNTVPFTAAPTAVVGALELIKTRINEAELGFNPNFNEVLTAAYMEEQKMAFHSDAERGLGPNVASLSLGAGAYMHFRVHAQYAAHDMPSGGSREVLTLFLRHGDVVVMEGAEIQQYYEHTVVPLNFRIAATARFIGNAHHGQ